MKRISVVILLLILLFLVGCSKKIEGEKEIEIEPYYTVTTDNEYTSNLYIDSTNINVKYSDDYFDSNHLSSLNLSLTKASFALACASMNESNVQNCFNPWGYGNIYKNNQYINDDDYTKAGLLIMSKVVGDKTIVACSIRGYYDFIEWKSNMMVGSSGDHFGFKIACLSIIDEINQYIEFNSLSNVILWVSGYSRGGAISNLIGKYINNDKIIDKYIYAFEAPRCAIDDGRDYSFINNIYIKLDFITYNFPFDLTLLGNNYDVTSFTNDEVLKEFITQNSISYHPSSFSLKNLKGENIEGSNLTLTEFYSIMLELLYVDTSKINELYIDHEVLNVSNRVVYANTLEKILVKIIDLIDTSTSSQLNKIINVLTDYTIEEWEEIFLKEKTSLFISIVKKALTEAKIEYNNDEIEDLCTFFLQYIYGILIYSNHSIKYLVSIYYNYNTISSYHEAKSLLTYLFSIN